MADASRSPAARGDGEPTVADRNALSRRRARLISYLVAVPTGLAIVAAVATLRTEWAVWTSQAELDEQTLRLDRHDRRAAPVVVGIEGPSAPRRLVYDALYMARETAYGRSPAERHALLDRAAGAAATAIASRPSWGEAWAVKAYIDALRYGPGAPATLADLTYSYRDAPYLAGAAAWRIRVGFGGWDRLQPAAQQHVLDEALWFARNDISLTPTVFDLARASGGYIPFATRWIELRKRDADLIERAKHTG